MKTNWNQNAVGSIGLFEHWGKVYTRAPVAKEKAQHFGLFGDNCIGKADGRVFLSKNSDVIVAADLALHIGYGVNDCELIDEVLAVVPHLCPAFAAFAAVVQPIVVRALSVGVQPNRCNQRRSALIDRKFTEIFKEQDANVTVAYGSCQLWEKSLPEKRRLLVVLCGFDFPRDQTHTKRQK